MIFSHTNVRVLIKTLRHSHLIVSATLEIVRKFYHSLQFMYESLSLCVDVLRDHYLSSCQTRIIELAN